MKKRTLRMLLIIAVFIGVLSIAISATGDPVNGTAEDDDGMLEPGEAIIIIPGINDETGANVNLEVIAIEGSEIKYLLTNENGRATYKDATPENYNIMFEYPIDGVPTVTLKGAKLINGQGHAFTIGRLNAPKVSDLSHFPCLVMVETDSIISGTYNVPGQPGTYSGIVCDNKNTVTISGPGKLTVTSAGMYPIWMDGYDLFLQNANISAASNISISAGVRPAIWVKNADIIIDNSIIEASSNSGPCIWVSDSVSGISERMGERYDITIQNGSNVKVFNPNSKLAAIGCSNKIYIKESQVEVIAKEKCFTTVPIFTNVGTIAGADRLTAGAYDPEKNSEYAYFLSVVEVVEPTEVPTGTEGTPDATDAPSTEETGTTETDATAETVLESTEATLGSTDGTVPPVTEMVQPTTPSDTIVPETAPAVTEPPVSKGNHSWIIFAAAGLVAVAAGAVWWFVIRKKVRK